MKDELEDRAFDIKVSIATKWSATTEIIVKLIQPIITVILARLLLPEDFGIVANLTMIISFAEMIADAGFSKYVIQHKFYSEKELLTTATVAFWSNMIISCLLFFAIFLFRFFLADLIGSKGYEKSLVIASLSIPLFALISIQKALYIRQLNFKTLFMIRVLSSLIPFAITIPIALFGGGYWSLIVGTLSTNLLTALVLTLKSSWKPQLYYDFAKFKSMFSFSYWTLIESFTIWLTSWVDIFLINKVLSPHYIGLYKNSISLVAALTGLVSASFIPVVFSALSRNQDNEQYFFTIYERNQKIVAYILFPMSIGLYLFRDSITFLLLGNNWSEAANIIGSWGLVSGFVIVYSGFASEVYRAKGKPRISVLHQMLWLLVIIPMVVVGVKVGFETFVFYRVLSRVSGIVIAFILLFIFFRFSPLSAIQNTISPMIASCAMGGFAILLKLILPSNIVFQLIAIILCMLFYYGWVRLFCRKDYQIITAYFFNK